MSFPSMSHNYKVVVVIPAYRVKKQILSVLRAIGPEVVKIYVVDDCCPEHVGLHVQRNCEDSRVQVIFRETNGGVGAAVMTGFREALREAADIVVKIDGDNQMDPRLLPEFIGPILRGEADYTKGNRFYRIDDLRGMPKIRLLGNAALSFVSKAMSGYWNIMDPTNGYTAIHRNALQEVSTRKVAEDYFFESDMLYNLSIIRAVVKDVPMTAVYADEKSNLSVTRTLLAFPRLYCSRGVRRIFYNYFLRDFNIGSLFLLISLILLPFGTAHGLYHWIAIGLTGRGPAAPGVVMMAGLSIILGFQALIMFLQQDISSIPSDALHRGSGQSTSGTPDLHSP